MTKEQEKAIKRIKNILNMPNTIEKVGHGNYSISTIKHKLYDDIDIKILLDMLEEREKEIDNLKQENLHWRGQYHLLSRKINVIPVKKVQDKIKELNDNKGYLKKFRDWTEKEYTNEDIIQNCIEVLEELLEEK